MNNIFSISKYVDLSNQQVTKKFIQIKLLLVGWNESLSPHAY